MLRFPRAEIEAHHETCPSRKRVETMMYKATEVYYKVPPIRQDQQPRSATVS